MKTILLIALLALSASAQWTEEEGVVVLTDDNFDDFIAKNEFALVEFYAPWCGHCKKLAPEYAKAAQALKAAETPVPLAKVDATEQKKVAERFSIQGFPTLKFFNNGNEVEYNGGRTEKEIINWITKRTGVVSTELKSVDEVQSFKDKEEVVLIYFGESESDAEFGVYKSLAMGNDDLSFGHTFVAEAASALNTNVKSVVLFKKFDEGRNDFKGEFNSSSLKEFVDSNSFATVMPFSDRAIEKVFQQGNPTLFLFANTNDESVAAEKAFAESAHANKGNKVLYSVSKPNDGHGHFQRLADYVGVNTAVVPSLMLVHASGDVNKYKFSSDITVENLNSFVSDFNNGKLEKYLKSEDIPEKNDEPVKVVVGKNFDDLVKNSSADVLLEFYAPWCGHCKALAPKYDNVAKQLQHNKNLIIAKIDATANEVPGVNIRGFPTIKFFPGNNKSNPVEFDGERTEEGIISWLKDHVSHEWVEPQEKIEDL